MATKINDKKTQSNRKRLAEGLTKDWLEDRANSQYLQFKSMPNGPEKDLLYKRFKRTQDYKFKLYGLDKRGA